MFVIHAGITLSTSSKYSLIIRNVCNTFVNTFSTLQLFVNHPLFVRRMFVIHSLYIRNSYSENFTFLANSQNCILNSNVTHSFLLWDHTLTFSLHFYNSYLHLLKPVAALAYLEF